MNKVSEFKDSIVEYQDENQLSVKAVSILEFVNLYKLAWSYYIFFGKQSEFDKDIWKSILKVLNDKVSRAFNHCRDLRLKK